MHDTQVQNKQKTDKNRINKKVIIKITKTRIVMKIKNSNTQIRKNNNHLMETISKRVSTVANVLETQ